MFTGIVQGMGTLLAAKRPSEDFCTYTVDFPKSMLEGLTIGASVAHNGCCLTVTRINGHHIDFDLMAETLAKTNLGELPIGSRINLERAARFGDEIGGHLMSGHIIAKTPITHIDISEHNHTVWLHLPENLKPYILPKGFIGLDGCSLTIGEVSDHAFCVHLIPETLRVTVFGMRQSGDIVNVEIDPQTQAVVDTVTRIMQNK